MEWQTVESAERPLDVDLNSSSKVNYVRRNITQKTVTEEDGTKRKVFQYEEMKVPKEYWYLYATQEKQQSDIDFLTMSGEEEEDEELI